MVTKLRVKLRPHWFQLLLNEAFGAEYVRADVRFSLQSKTTKKPTGEIRWEPIVPEDPCKLELKKRYESKLIKEAFKWSPVKRYYKKFRGRKTEELKMKIELFLRDCPDLDGFADEVPFVLIFTLRDTKRQSPVYDEVTSKLHSLNVITEGIQLKRRAKEMAR